MPLVVARKDCCRPAPDEWSWRDKFSGWAEGIRSQRNVLFMDSYFFSIDSISSNNILRLRNFLLVKSNLGRHHALRQLADTWSLNFLTSKTFLMPFAEKANFYALRNKRKKGNFYAIIHGTTAFKSNMLHTNFFKASAFGRRRRRSHKTYVLDEMKTRGTNW